MSKPIYDIVLEAMQPVRGLHFVSTPKLLRQEVTMRFPIPRGGNGNNAFLQMRLNQRLPHAPAPRCLACQAPMQEDAVKRVSIEPVTHGAFKVACLVKCRCGARHIGYRAIAADMRTTRFLSQEFELYSEAAHGPALRAVQARIAKKADKLAEIEARPVIEHLGPAAH